MFPRLAVGSCNHVRGIVEATATCDEFEPRNAPKPRDDSVRRQGSYVERWKQGDDEGSEWPSHAVPFGSMGDISPLARTIGRTLKNGTNPARDLVEADHAGLSKRGCSGTSRSKRDTDRYPGLGTGEPGSGLTVDVRREVVRAGRATSAVGRVPSSSPTA